ncbi:class I SAM-dependent methyltransferase [Psychromarinibacter sp. S121]|uniref:class I SAM-dependent methyltransferase n=1 Tax=Psychromarinibacter sp. S121 TaxID=3415127 RepID=UPI003C7BE33F
MSDPILTLYQGLERLGPGAPEDVAWAAHVADVPPDARICDAGCGTGADIPALMAVAPVGHVTAVDEAKLFIDEVLARYGTTVRAYAGDMVKLKGPYDFIWSAGAVYFHGVTKVLRAWRPVLAKGGAVAFSEPCLFTDTPSEAAVAFWGGYTPLTDAAGIAKQVGAADYEVLATRRVSDAAWQSYYGPLAERVEALRRNADPALALVLDEAATEIAAWETVRGETGYLLSVVRPA